LERTHKTLEGAQHPDRDAQFRYVNEQARSHLQAGQPVVSVDTKKKELVGRGAYPQAERLLVTADAGGSNGYRVRGCGSPSWPGSRPRRAFR